MQCLIYLTSTTLWLIEDCADCPESGWSSNIFRRISQVGEVPTFQLQEHDTNEVSHGSIDRT